jgi:hypothetical protein
MLPLIHASLLVVQLVVSGLMQALAAQPTVGKQVAARNTAEISKVRCHKFVVLSFIELPAARATVLEVRLSQAARTQVSHPGRLSCP